MGLFSRKPKVSLSSITFDTSSYAAQGGDDTRLAWFTPAGDGIGLFYFPIAPDLPPNGQSRMDLQDFYLKQINNDQVRIVEMDLPVIDEVSCIWLLLKVPQQPTGATYIGSLTIPFKDFSFVVKMQCAEQGTTGMREAALFAKAYDAGKVSLGENGQVQGDWNPDSDEYDELFPNHPLSRLRREFADIRQSLYIEDGVKRSKQFLLPPR